MSYERNKTHWIAYNRNLRIWRQREAKSKYYQIAIFETQYYYIAPFFPTKKRYVKCNFWFVYVVLPSMFLQYEIEKYPPEIENDVYRGVHRGLQNNHAVYCITTKDPSDPFLCLYDLSYSWREGGLLKNSGLLRRTWLLKNLRILKFLWRWDPEDICHGK